MYSFPKDVDLSLLNGSTLEMICFNINQISLHFEKRASVIVESSLRYTQPGKTAQMLSPPVRQADIMQLIGRRIEHAASTATNSLLLSFGDAGQIECVASPDGYESYHLSFDGKTITV
ncbi:MAG: hypothetical protein KGI37_08510 [Alphaproteobacteria bacterium]|nr:hypothetical protein [Alphaproteobacteria bacterium]